VDQASPSSNSPPATRAARTASNRWLSAGECLVALAEHFIETWRAQLKQANTLQRRIRARYRHFCQVPGCSRAAVHAHHIKPRSQGGSDDPENLISLCAAHHLHGIHGGRMRVTGTAPDKLVWEFGLRRSYVAAA
jgi:5-methylcytosine-specific restriction endonuclease McrA